MSALLPPPAEHTIRIIRANSTPGAWYNTRVGEVFKAGIWKNTLKGDDGRYECWSVTKQNGSPDDRCVVSIGDAEEVTAGTLSRMEALEQRVGFLEQQLKIVASHAGLN